MKETKKLISNPLLICLAAVLGICSVLPASAGEVGAKKSEVGKQHERVDDKIFEKQDADANKSRKLAAEGKYAEAITVLERDVVEQLKLQAGDIDSWKARKRLAEYSEELRNLQLTYGNLLLDMAEKSMDNGDFPAAIISAGEAKKVTPLLRRKADRIIEVASGRKKATERAEKVSTKNTDPGLEKREVTLRYALSAARMFFRKGLYDEALKKIEEVYALNPYNTEAAYLATQIYKKFYQIGNQRRRADLQAQFAYEAWQWVEPTFPLPTEDKKETTGTQVRAASDSAINSKLDSIYVDAQYPNGIELDGLLRKLDGDSAALDPDGKGVRISLLRENEEVSEKKKNERNPNGPADPNADPNADPEGDSEGDPEDDSDDDSEDDSDDEKKPTEKAVTVTIDLEKVPLRQVLDYISYLTGYTYFVRPDEVVFGAPDRDMITEDYEIYDTVKFLIVGRKPVVATPPPAEPAGGDDAGGADAGGDDMGGGDDAGGGDDMGGGDDAGMEDPGMDAAAATVDDSELTPEALQKFFSLYGLEFPKGSSISFYRGSISMNNTKKNHQMMEELLERINIQSDMIEVEVKSIELAENDMEELGFNWALGGFGENGSSKSWMFGKGENTSGGGTLNMLNGLLSGVDSRLISNLNLFPDLFGSFKPFGSDVNFNLTLTINALDRSDRTEQISAPRVLVANGATAVVKMTKAYFFPEEWEELEVETEEIGDQGDLQLNITYPSPTFAETESNIGTEFTVTPTILEGGKTIRLKLNPKVTAYTGKDEYEVVLVVEELNGDNWTSEEMRFVVWRPVIATREIAVTVDVYNGETMVIGGLSDSQSQKRLDKIPILADIPFIGRLFQNQSEVSVRRNMLIFVTARLIDNSGIPRRVDSRVGRGGIPMLMR
ncbi:MAG: hypothetical protein IJW33_05680 [Lentisphaeria bacterium]|nr:hypothetical protein [Lentisphaeria bacterium]